MAILDLDLNPPQRALRVFGIAAGVVFLGGGAWAWHADWINGLVATIAGLIGVFSLLASIIWPSGNRALYIGLSVLAWPIGLVVSYIVLGALYFLVFTPLGLFFRLIGRDALHLRAPKSGGTNWTPYEKRGGLERYFRQF